MWKRLLPRASSSGSSSSSSDGGGHLKRILRVNGNIYLNRISASSAAATKGGTTARSYPSTLMGRRVLQAVVEAAGGEVDRTKEMRDTDDDKTEMTGFESVREMQGLNVDVDVDVDAQAMRTRKVDKTNEKELPINGLAQQQHKHSSTQKSRHAQLSSYGLGHPNEDKDNKWYRMATHGLDDHDSSLQHTSCPPLVLFDFANCHADALDAQQIGIAGEGWLLSDDETLGGYSRGMLRLMHYNGGDGDESAEKKKEEVQEEGVVPFLRWEGSTDTSLPHYSSSTPPPSSTTTTSSNTPSSEWRNEGGPLQRSERVRRCGFCAIRSPPFSWIGARLRGDYNALEITCRGWSYDWPPEEEEEEDEEHGEGMDMVEQQQEKSGSGSGSGGRTYTVNLKVSTYFPDDLYQGFLHVPNATTTTTTTSALPPSSTNNSLNHHPHTNDEQPWQTMILPFVDFLHTSYGHPREIQRQLDDVTLENIGLTLMDGVDGDFALDVLRIRAVNCYGGMVVE